MQQQILCILLLIFVDNVSSASQNRILYGDIVDPEYYGNSIVSVLAISADKEIKRCTGTFITNQHVLIALHCVQDNQGKIFPRIFVNIFDDDSGKVIIRSQHIDIAIIEFPEGTKFQKPVTPMSLAKDNFTDADNQLRLQRTAFIVGYGFYGYDGEVGERDGKLRVAKVPLWPIEWCPVLGTLCTSDYSPLAVAGDSGGPLIFNKIQQQDDGRNLKSYQFGIIANVDFTSKYNYHTPIAPNCGWIEEVTKGKAECITVFGENRNRLHALRAKLEENYGKSIPIDNSIPTNEVSFLESEKLEDV